MNPLSGDTPRGIRRGRLPPGTMLGFILAVVAVLLIAFVNYIALQSRTEAAERLTHSVEVMEQVQALLSAVKDAETGQRGYLLTGAEPYLAPYTNARADLPGLFKNIRRLVADNRDQLLRVDSLEQLTGEKLEELGQTITLRRNGDEVGSLDLVRSDRGKLSMDRIRTITTQMQNEERTLLATRQQDWQDAVKVTAAISWGGSALLLVLIAGAGAMTSRDFRTRETEAWIRAGLAGMGPQLQGDQRLDQLGEKALAYLADYLDAQVGAVYVAEADGRYHRVAGHAVAPGNEHENVRDGDGLLGQAAKENRTLYVQDVPEDYLSVASGLGHSKSRTLLIAPASADGVVQAILELGFFRKLKPADRDLLDRVLESLGVAVRSAKDRTRLEELLEETQRQSEELQAQQEELRVNNEELEEQGRALKESQVQMEAQQAELEQTNSQLEEQTQMLEHQKDDLAAAQTVLTDKAAELERSNQYKSEFLANMSHELRTPLNSTLILAKLLADNKDGNLSNEQVKFAQTISGAGNDLLTLINDILDLSKIESGKVEVQVEAVNIARTVESLQRGLLPVANEKGLTLSASVEPGTAERIATDAQRLGQILKNLLSNALKFTDKGEVSLRVLSNAENVLFAIRDTGIGIPQHQQEIIFEAFRQADGSTHRKYGGTGLGLSISRDLARLLGGDISVRSTAGNGSIFTLTLPLVYVSSMTPVVPIPRGTPQARVDTHINTPSSPEQPGGSQLPAGALQKISTALSPIEMEDDRDQLSTGSRLILVIEDDVRFAAILRDLSHEMGFQCVVTHTANDGLAAATKYVPSAILLDMNLPDHSGLGVLDQLKHNPRTRHIPVHVASVADYTQEALGLGAIGYALKPVKREQLIEALKRLEAKFSQSLRRVLVVEDDERQRTSILQLLSNDDVQITDVGNAADALVQLQANTFDCMVMDLNLPDLSGYELLDRMAEQEEVSFPPVIVYTGRSLTRDEEQKLRRFSKSIIIKDARSPERLLDEVTLFLHQVESSLPAESQRILKVARDREATLDGRRILVVEDDVRNIFALSSILEPKGAKVEIARNGREAIDALTRSLASTNTIDLVLMDIMMPEMDGFTAMREIRKRVEWKKLPIIALTAKAMRDDQEKCLAAGANDYIAKPLDVEKLLSLVRVWMPK
ncbi:MAG: histidine kinase [Rhodocyclales bacterium]|nr:histidine kinase [Rhodocyclales bacterium]